MSAELDRKKNDILSRLNIQAEYENIGIQFTTSPNKKGWIQCKNPYKIENRASCGINIDTGSPSAGFLVMFNMNGNNGKPKTMSFWDVMGDFKPGLNGNFKTTFNYFAEKAGITLLQAKRKKENRPPSQEYVDELIKDLTPDVRQYLRDKRGFTDETIERYQIGWDTKRKRNSYPVLDETGKIINIRFHNSKAKTKTMSISGYGEASIFNLQELAKTKEGDTVIISEGECFNPDVTEILTPNGWIKLADYKNEDVLQYMPSGMSKFVRPIAYILKPNTHTLCTYSTEDYFSLTTFDHNMVVYNTAKSQIEKHKAKDLPINNACVIPNTTELYDGTGLSKTEFNRIRFAIASECVSHKNYSKTKNQIRIEFKFLDQYEDPAYRRYCIERMDQILIDNDILSLDTFYDDGRTIMAMKAPEWLSSYDKFDINWIARSTIMQRRMLVNEFHFWHKMEYPHITQFEFESEIYQNAIFLQTLIHLSGLTSEIITESHGTIKRYITIFSMLIAPGIKTDDLIKSHSKVAPKRIACVQVPSGMILTRQKGHISVSGNCDAIILSQNTGMTAVSPTNGCNTFLPEWVERFEGLNVVLCYDSDKEGRSAVKNLVIPNFKKPVMEGRVKSIKVIWLFDTIDKANKDATDWFVKAGATKSQFMEILLKTKNYVYTLPNIALPRPIVLNSFTDVERSELVGKRVTLPLYIYGENSETYHVINKVKVTFCSKLISGDCTKRLNSDWPCEDPIPIRKGDRIQLACIQASDAQVKSAVREYICDKGRRPSVDIIDEDRTTVRELFAHQVFKERIGAETGELVDKTIYNIGSEVITIGQYQATGFIHSHPRNQRPTMMIDTIKKQAEDWQTFDLEKSRPMLRKIQKMDLMEIVGDIVDNITNIYNREDVHLGILLTLCSPQWIDLPGDGRIRGWMSSVLVGDSGTGKSVCAEKIMNHANVGYRVSGMTSSRTGITYAIDRDDTHGWRIKAGAMLKMSRQALIVDEAQDLDEHDIKTMAEAMDSGKLSIDRIENRTYEAMTRCIFLCNPKMTERTANQRTMDSFRYGCQSLLDIFPQMMIRRIDLGMFAARFDIEDKTKLYKRKKDTRENIVTEECFRSLVHFAWNISPKNIIITDSIGDIIRKKSFEMGEKFGQCIDLPLICPEDFRKTLARISTAVAILDLSSDDDLQTIIVRKEHVEWVVDAFLTPTYTALNCRLNQYSDQYKTQNILMEDEKEKLYQEFVAELNSAGKETAKRMLYMFKEVAEMDPNEMIKATQREFSEHLSCDIKTVRKDMAWFVINNLVKSSRGYKPLNKCIIFYNYCLDKDMTKRNRSEKLFLG